VLLRKIKFDLHQKDRKASGIAAQGKLKPIPARVEHALGMLQPRVVVVRTEGKLSRMTIWVVDGVMHELGFAGLRRSFHAPYYVLGAARVSGGQLKRENGSE